MEHPGHNNRYFKTQTISNPISDFKGISVLVEADHYLRGFLEDAPYQEPLLAALGGTPLALKSHIEADLDQWKKHDITPLFVFEGQSMIGREEMALRSSESALALTNQAWDFYHQNQAPAAVEGFGKSGAVKASSLYRFFQNILFHRKLYFRVATHNAGPYLAYYDTLENRSTELLMGSYDLLLFKIHNALMTKFDWENGVVWGLEKSQVLKELDVDDDAFADAYLMTGTTFLPTCPTLKDKPVILPQTFPLKDAISQLRTYGFDINKFWHEVPEIVQAKEPKWLDNYRKVKMSLKHSVYLQTNGQMLIENYDEVTGDNHEWAYLRLSDEIYHLINVACIGNRVPNWLASLEMLVPPPLAGEETEEYRNLVTKQLVPVQEQAAALYASRMNRAFQHKNITIRFWFDHNHQVKMNLLGLQPTPQSVVNTWAVPQAVYENRKNVNGAKPGSLRFALASLKDETFAPSTITSSNPKPNSLKTTSEVMTNVLWRFLHLRGYINNDHQLSTWGKALLTAISTVNPSYNSTHNLDEAMFLAFELLRYDLLNGRNDHPEIIGSPTNGSDDQNTHCLLIARCACLLKLRHGSIGFTGPLSKNLLTFQSIISAVRTCDRDLIESVLGAMFMYAHADRYPGKASRSDWTELGISLPFVNDIDVGLGIAVKTYLDELAEPLDDAAARQAIKQSYATKPIAHGINVPEDLDVAFEFFEGLHEGITELGKIDSDFRDVNLWDSARQYLNNRR